MPSQPSAPPLVDALKASASKLKEQKSALEARAKELDALKAQLDAQRDELERQSARLGADREALDRERVAFKEARASVDRDLASIAESREKLEGDEARLREGAKALDARAETFREDEARLERLEKAVTERMADAEARLQALVERETELVKAQTDWLAGFEAGGKTLLTMIGEMQTRQQESAQQHASLVDLHGALRDELGRLVAEREKIEAKERSLLEAHSFLASALETSEAAETVVQEAPAPPPTPVAEPTPAPEPSEPPEAPPPAPTEYVVHEEAVAKPKATKAEALNRLTRAVEAWKRARDAGQDVGNIRKTLLRAREVLDAGDYETALRIANETLERLQAAPLAR